MGSARIENKDSTDYEVKVKVSGSGQTIKIKGSSTTTVSWNGGSHDAVLESGNKVTFPDNKLEDHGSYKIQGGKASK